jgi:proliferating cell nuclear antigen
MYLKTVQATAFKSLLEVLKDIINDVNVYFDSTGMKIIAFDVARVTLVYVKLDAENFEEYSCPDDVVLGINVSNTFKLLKSISNNDILTITNDYENLVITVSNDTKKSTSKFSIRLLDLNEDILEIPEEESDRVKLDTLVPSVDFQKMIRDMSNIGSELLIRRFENKVEFSCAGDFAEKQTIIEQPEDVSPNNTSGTFSLKYLSMFTKATILCPLVQIIQDQEESTPVVFKYTIANLGELRFYLASVV